jgi:hypothetical protein
MDPISSGQLSREEIEGVGYAYGELATFQRRYDHRELTDGWNRLPDGERLTPVRPYDIYWC